MGELAVLHSEVADAVQVLGSALELSQTRVLALFLCLDFYFCSRFVALTDTRSGTARSTACGAAARACESGTRERFGLQPMTDFWAAAPSNGLGLDPAPAAKPLKKNPKPFIGRLEVQPKVVLGDPCDISAFCSRHARARRLYDDRRWDDLLKFMQEPRTRAWWSEPLVYRPEEFRSQPPYLEREYFANADCGGVVKVCLPGEGNGAAWADVSKLSVKELASKLRDRAILPTGVRKEDARTLEKQLDVEAARRLYCMVAKGPKGDSMWSDIQSLQREPLDPRGEFLVNYGKNGANSTALTTTGSNVGSTQSATGAGFWLDDEVAFAFYFLARQRVLSPTDRGNVPYVVGDDHVFSCLIDWAEHRVSPLMCIHFLKIGTRNSHVPRKT